ncbi:hypothetical protein GALL_549520 [mine drainage metagenome]|uniref:Uncharacterized protein n=1 Tax=mine drainage metagenome TaxID=410659 RepID=A0A1J5PE47_9ZZZZ
MPMVRVALYQIAARRAVSGLPPSARVRSATSRLARPVASTGSSRTPSGLSPARVIPARIHQATIGGWS